MVTILDIAIAKGVKHNEDGSISMGEFEELSLPFFAGCQHCEASLGPAQSFPSTTGYIQCRHCIGAEIGFETVEEFDAWVRENCQEEETDDREDFWNSYTGEN